MKRFGGLLLFLGLTLSLVQVGWAGDGAVRPLSLREALDLADSNSYQILASENQRRETAGRNQEAWRAYLPQLTVSERGIRTTDPVGVFGIKLRQGVFTMSDFDLQQLNDPERIDNYATAIEVRQPLLNPDAMFGKSAAGAASKAAEFAALRTREAVALEVERSYFGLVLAHGNLGTIAQAVKSAETHHREVDAAYAKGLVSEADLLSSQVRLAEMEEQRLTAELDIANAEDHLKYLLGMKEAASILPTDSLSIAEGDLDVPEAGLTAAPADRSDLLSLRYQEEAARKGLWMRRGEWIPRLNLFGSTEWHDADAFGTSKNIWTMGFALEWNIFDGLGQWGRRSQAGAAAASASIQYKEAQARSGMEVRRAYRSLTTARERVGVARKAVGQSRESLRIVEARFRQGLERVSELIDKESANTNAELRLKKATYDFKIAQSELKFYLGSGHKTSGR
jgi:outer membrane protein TolC